MNEILTISPKHLPTLDPEFIPAFLWNKAYREKVKKCTGSQPIAIAMKRQDQTCSVYRTSILPDEEQFAAINQKYVERIVKFLFWQRRGRNLLVGGAPHVVAQMQRIYSNEGSRSFDYRFIGQKLYDGELTINSCSYDEIPENNVKSTPLGRNLDGCRIGFDLGGSDRKAAAIVDGKVIFSEEIPWQPYFEKDPQYHFDGIQDSLNRANQALIARGLKVQAIGGSAAGIYDNNEVKFASLFRSVPEDAFDKHIRYIFFRLKELWGNIPFEVVNDGEVAALAGSMSLNDNNVLGISMGTSLAVGYIDGSGHITPWLNELAFVPVDYRDNAPADEWSGDLGCGVQYFSQQAVGRLASSTGFNLPKDMPLPEQLKYVQERMSKGDERAQKIYETIGVYFGYTIAHFSEFYDHSIRNLLVFGRVTTGEGCNIIIEKAKKVLQDECPEIHAQIEIKIPKEEDEKRHGQAIAAASLPSLVA